MEYVLITALLMAAVFYMVEGLLAVRRKRSPRNTEESASPKRVPWVKACILCGLGCSYLLHLVALIIELAGKA